MTSTSDLLIEDLLADLGLTGNAAAEARRMLEAAGVTNPRKRRIATSKAARAREVIDDLWQRMCHNCRPRAVNDGRVLVTVPQRACPVCLGSTNSRAVMDMVLACQESGVRRLLVVGGSPSVRKELTELIGDQLDLKTVDGTRAGDKGRARSEIAWADLIVVLGASELAHKVSNLYTRDPKARTKLITTSRRGIAALADEVVRSDMIRGSRR